MCAVKNGHVIGPSRVSRTASSKPIYQTTKPKHKAKRKVNPANVQSAAPEQTNNDVVFSSGGRESKKKPKMQTVAVRLR